MVLLRPALRRSSSLAFFGALNGKNSEVEMKTFESPCCLRLAA